MRPAAGGTNHYMLRNKSVLLFIDVSFLDVDLALICPIYNENARILLSYRSNPFPLDAVLISHKIHRVHVRSNAQAGF